MAERLGHSTVAITLDTYSHVTPRVNEDAANKFEEALRQAESTAEETTGQPNFTQLYSEQKKKRAEWPSISCEYWQEREDSNPRPLVLESNGICLTPYRQASFRTDVLTQRLRFQACCLVLSCLVLSGALAKALARKRGSIP